MEIITYLDEPTNERGRYGVYSAAWSPDSQHIVSGNWAGDVRLWDVSTGEIVYSVKSTSQSLDWGVNIVRDLRFSRHGEYIYSIAGNGTIRNFNASTGELVEETQLPNSVSAAQWSPDGAEIAYGSAENSLAIFHWLDIDVNLDDINLKTNECFSDEIVSTSFEPYLSDSNMSALITEVETQRDEAISDECTDELVEMANLLLEAEAE